MNNVGGGTSIRLRLASETSQEMWSTSSRLPSILGIVDETWRCQLEPVNERLSVSLDSRDCSQKNKSSADWTKEERESSLPSQEAFHVQHSCSPKKLGSELRARNRICGNTGRVIIRSAGDNARTKRLQQQSHPSNWGKGRHERVGVCTLSANRSANPLTILRGAPYKSSAQSDPM